MRPRFLHVLALFGAAALFAGNTTSPAAQQSDETVGSQPFRGEIAFSFISAVQEFGPVAFAEEPHQERHFVEQQILTGDDVLSRLVGQADPQQIRRHAYGNAILIARLENLSTGEEWREVVAACENLDLEYSDASPFGGSAICDQRRISYTVLASHLAVLEDGKPMLRYRLDPGLYMIDGVPMVVN